MFHHAVSHVHYGITESPESSVLCIALCVSPVLSCGARHAEPHMQLRQACDACRLADFLESVMDAVEEEKKRGEGGQQGQ